VNSGPPGFVNGGGHANFDPSRFDPGAVRSTVTRVTLPDRRTVTLPPGGGSDVTIGGLRFRRG
jgi:hypothetical protein